MVAEVDTVPATLPDMVRDPDTQGSLADRIKAEIHARGPMTFARFMDLALYDPSEGFYSDPPVGEGPGTAFATSPHVSPVYGLLLARQIQELWEQLGRPRPFLVAEAGAGDGTLARQILDGLPPETADAVRYVGIERSAAGRAAVEAAGIAATADLDAVEPAEFGCILANELLDNLPFHRVRLTHRGLVELFVGIDGADGSLTLVEGVPSTPDLVASAPPLSPGQEAVIGLGAVRFVERAAGLVQRGYIWIVDYASPAGEPAAVHGYRSHRVEGDVLAEPGSRDITAGVDFQSLVRRAHQLGLSSWGPAGQRAVLLALGFRQLDQAAQRRQVEAIAARRGVEALRIYSNRTRANLLLASEGLGGFQVLCLGVDTEITPKAFRALTD
jgi:SAM-dependent MidA family methyltransferase